MALPRAPLVGAHYYHWYPSNWGHGTLRAQLDPPQQPELGLYDSTDPAVAEQHIAWASAHAIDFFTLNWWPVAPQENPSAIPAFIKSPTTVENDLPNLPPTWKPSFTP